MRLVVDVNVVASSGGPDATHQHSQKCRNILTTIYENHHKIVISSDLRAECVRHASSFSVEWYYAMKRDDLIEDIHNVRNSDLRIKILECFPNKGTKKRIEKDIHLIEAALNTDKKIISNNSREREDFNRIALTIIELNEIIWVSTIYYEDLVRWLRTGAFCYSAPQHWFLISETS